MKKRRTVIAAFLLLAVMVMGIGFANLTDNLSINGEASLATNAAQEHFNEFVTFTDAQLVSTTGTSGVDDTFGVGQNDPDSAHFGVKSLGLAGQVAVFKFQITNAHTEFDASISLDAAPVNNNTEFFTVTYSVEENVVNEGPIDCPASSSVWVYVTVTLLKSPQVNTSASFTINMTATSDDPTPVAP